MTVIIGIDPGSRVTGYGLIHWQGNQSHYLASGCISVGTLDLHERLQTIFSEIQAIIRLYQPKEAAIEQIFMHQNPNSALKLGQARGVAIVALALPVAEYSARQVKQSVVGYGAAGKLQVALMVKRLLNIPDETLTADAADALAIALCHAHSRFCLNKIGVKQTKKRSSSWRHYLPEKL